MGKKKPTFVEHVMAWLTAYVVFSVDGTYMHEGEVVILPAISVWLMKSPYDDRRTLIIYVMAFKWALRMMIVPILEHGEEAPE